MKKIIIAVLLTACTTSAFAEPDDFAMVAGKKVTISDTRKSLIQKFGKPKLDTATYYSSWEIPNDVSINATYHSGILENFEVTRIGTKAINNYIKVGGKTIYLYKDTINNALAKVKHACFELSDGSQVSNYTMQVASHNSGNWYQTALTVIDAGNIKALRNSKISSFNFGYGVSPLQENCNY